MQRSFHAGGRAHIVARTEVELRADTDEIGERPRNDRGVRVTVLFVDDHVDFRAWAGATSLGDDDGPALDTPPA